MIDKLISKDEWKIMVDAFDKRMREEPRKSRLAHIQATNAAKLAKVKALEVKMAGELGL